MRRTFDENLSAPKATRSLGRLIDKGDEPFCPSGIRGVAVGKGAPQRTLLDVHPISEGQKDQHHDDKKR